MRFSAIDTRPGPYRKATREWRALGIQDELGRKDNHLGYSNAVRKRGHKGTSSFDPVLSAMVYRSFCPRGGLVLDPFAGGSVRGIVAAKLGRSYVGVELRPEQIEANIKQRDRIVPGSRLQWIEGDARDIGSLCAGIEADLIFTCPPYFTLERYSDDQRDLSTEASWQEFSVALSTIIKRACSLLKDDRFAVIVVGPVRGKDGMACDLREVAIRAFSEAGLGLYNDVVQFLPLGSGAFRANKVNAHGKVVNAHAYALVFVKGNWKAAASACRARQKRAFK